MKSGKEENVGVGKRINGIGRGGEGRRRKTYAHGENEREFTRAG